MARVEFDAPAHAMLLSQELIPDSVVAVDYVQPSSDSSPGTWSQDGCSIPSNSNSNESGNKSSSESPKINDSVRQTRSKTKTE